MGIVIAGTVTTIYNQDVPKRQHHVELHHSTECDENNVCFVSNDTCNEET